VPELELLAVLELVQVCCALAQAAKPVPDVVPADCILALNVVVQESLVSEMKTIRFRCYLNQNCYFRQLIQTNDPIGCVQVFLQQAQEPDFSEYQQ
jgi:hypothetical protein